MRHEQVAASTKTIPRISVLTATLFILVGFSCAQSPSKTSPPNELRHYDIRVSDLPAPEVQNGPRNQSRVIPKPEGAELCNCQKIEPEHIDFHLWLVKDPTNVGTPSVAKPDSIVVEMTPRVRKNHPDWTVEKLTEIANNHTLVRVSGWLTFDQEHPEQIGVQRHNLWEIHPVIKMEFQQNGQWKTL